MCAQDTTLPLQDLWKDIDGDDDDCNDVDVLSILQQIEQALTNTSTCNQARLEFQEQHGYRLVCFYLDTGDYYEQAIAVLKAAAGPDLSFWPDALWQHLVEERKLLPLLAWAANDARADVVKQKLLHISALSSSSSLLSRLFTTVLLHTKARPSTMELALDIIHHLFSGNDCANDDKNKNETAEDTTRLFQQHNPLTMLCAVYASAPDIAKAHQGPPMPPPHIPKSEVEAYISLVEKQRAVYNPTSVRLRRKVLSTMKSLCSHHRSLVLHECLIRSASVTTEGPLVEKIIKIVGDVEGAAPRKSAPVLGADGTVESYEKRPFAADYEDNPAGDFLLLPNDDSNLALPDLEPLSALNGSGPTLLELSLDILLLLCQSSKAVATALYRRGVINLCARLSCFLTPTILRKVQHLAAAVCQRCPVALERALATPEQSIHILIGISTVDDRALELLGRRVEGCSGGDFEAMIDEECGVLSIALEKKAAHLLFKCAKRSFQWEQKRSVAATTTTKTTTETLQLPRSLGGWKTLHSNPQLKHLLSSFFMRAGISTKEKKEKEKQQPPTPPLPSPPPSRYDHRVHHAGGGGLNTITFEDITDQP